MFGNRNPGGTAWNEADFPCNLSDTAAFGDRLYKLLIGVFSFHGIKEYPSFFLPTSEG